MGIFFWCWDFLFYGKGLVRGWLVWGFLNWEVGIGVLVVRFTCIIVLRSTFCLIFMLVRVGEIGVLVIGMF